MRWFWTKILSFLNWKIIGDVPRDINKYIIIVAPHTSNWDFMYGVIIRGAVGFKSNFLGKDSLFNSPFGFFFRMLGGIPVKRNFRNNMVDQVAMEARKRASFILTIAPEGTRKGVTKWKTGFYYIAVQADIPIVMCQFDFQNKEARFIEPFYPSGNIDKDMPLIQSKFIGVKGYADIK